MAETAALLADEVLPDVLLRQWVISFPFPLRYLVAPYLVQGGTDAKHFTGLSDHVYRFAMFRLTPETRSTFHGLNERIAIKDYMLAIQYFYQLMEKSAFSDPS